MATETEAAKKYLDDRARRLAEEEKQSGPTPQMTVRVDDTRKARWQDAAQIADVTVSEQIRDLMDEWAESVLECAHPAEYRVTYPWSERCAACGKRFR